MKTYYEHSRLAPYLLEGLGSEDADDNVAPPIGVEANKKDEAANVTMTHLVGASRPKMLNRHNKNKQKTVNVIILVKKTNPNPGYLISTVSRKTFETAKKDGTFEL